MRSGSPGLFPYFQGEGCRRGPGLVDSIQGMPLLEVDGSLDAQGRAAGLPIALEEIPLVRFAGREAELVQIDGIGHGDMHAAQVDHQLVVDEHPNIIIPAEFEWLSRYVGKGRMGFAAEISVALRASRDPTRGIRRGLYVTGGLSIGLRPGPGPIFGITTPFTEWLPVRLPKSKSGWALLKSRTVMANPY
jgi:hypothetical protein